MQQVLDGGNPLGHAPPREPVLRHAVEESCAVRIAVAADDDVNYAQGNSPEIIEVGVEEVHADVSLDAGRQDHRVGTSHVHPGGSELRTVAGRAQADEAIRAGV